MCPWLDEAEPTGVDDNDVRTELQGVVEIVALDPTDHVNRILVQEGEVAESHCVRVVLMNGDYEVGPSVGFDIITLAVVRRAMVIATEEK